MARHTVSALLAMLLLSGAANPLRTTTESTTTIVATSTEQQKMAEWALARYDAAGLELPPLAIEFVGPNLEACEGSPARVHLNKEPILIRMCWNDDFMLLHELAHVWEARNVPESKHEAFASMREDVTSWASPDVPWGQRGREHAANVIAWGLLEEPFPISRTYPNDPKSLIIAFSFLTGTEPLHDGGDPIQSPDRRFFRPDRVNSPLESGR
ncbi:MAG: hypothetical protein ABFR89_11430 [Actinomycetota bacterium]